MYISTVATVATAATINEETGSTPRAMALAVLGLVLPCPRVAVVVPPDDRLAANSQDQGTSPTTDRMRRGEPEYMEENLI